MRGLEPTEAQQDSEAVEHSDDDEAHFYVTGSNPVPDMVKLLENFSRLQSIYEEQSLQLQTIEQEKLETEFSLTEATDALAKKDATILSLNGQLELEHEETKNLNARAGKVAFENTVLTTKLQQLITAHVGLNKKKQDMEHQVRVLHQKIALIESEEEKVQADDAQVAVEKFRRASFQEGIGGSNGESTVTNSRSRKNLEEAEVRYFLKSEAIVEKMRKVKSDLDQQRRKDMEYLLVAERENRINTCSQWEACIRCFCSREWFDSRNTSLGRF